MGKSMAAKAKGASSGVVKKKKPRRVVLGVGYPDIDGHQFGLWNKNPFKITGGVLVELNVRKIILDKKIRLVAECLDD